MHYYIITGGPIGGISPEMFEDGTVICADGGTDIAARLGIIPQKVVGDLDSISEDGLAYIDANHIPVEKYPVEKDWTDTEIALRSIPEGSCITIVCPLDGGGRLDHVIGNIQLASSFASLHERIVLTDGFTSVYLMDGNDSITVDITGRSGLAVSLVPLSFDVAAAGVSTTGLYYGLERIDLTAGKTFSFCNEPEQSSDEFSISMESGRLAVIVTKKV